MPNAVLFDWGHTLMDFRWDPALLARGHEAGLRALGLEPSPPLTARFEERYLPLLLAPDTLEEVEYPGLVRELLTGAGIDVDDAGLGRFLEAEHAEWDQARVLGATTHALLDALRTRGIRLGLVSNVFDPGWLVRRDLDGMGLTERLDAIVLSSEIGWRKPDPRIYRAALDTLDVAPEEAIFVGDRLLEDVAGPSALGIGTVLALWYRIEESDEIEPDARAHAPLDVLEIVDRVFPS